MKHDWYLDEDGHVDVFRFDGDAHNGPECRRCGWFGCHHCERAYYKNDIFEEECPSSHLDLPFGDVIE